MVEIWLGVSVIMFLYRKCTKLIVSLVRVHRPKKTLNMKQRDMLGELEFSSSSSSVFWWKSRAVTISISDRSCSILYSVIGVIPRRIWRVCFPFNRVGVWIWSPPSWRSNYPFGLKALTDDVSWLCRDRALVKHRRVLSILQTHRLWYC